MVPEERWEAGHVLVTDVGTVSTQPIHLGVRVPGVEQHEGIEDQPQRPDLVLSELAEHTEGCRFLGLGLLRLVGRVAEAPYGVPKFDG